MVLIGLPSEVNPMSLDRVVKAQEPVKRAAVRAKIHVRTNSHRALTPFWQSNLDDGWGAQ